MRSRASRFIHRHNRAPPRPNQQELATDGPPGYDGVATLAAAKAALLALRGVLLALPQTPAPPAAAPSPYYGAASSAGSAIAHAIAHHAGGHACRHGAAADMLLLLAHTNTFATPRAHVAVRGAPVQVRARESDNTN